VSVWWEIEEEVVVEEWTMRGGRTWKRRDWRAWTLLLLLSPPSPRLPVPLHQLDTGHS
jgi:hypothetical protein